MSDTTTVHQALALVTASVGAVPKAGEMTHGDRYNYRRIEDLLARIQPALATYGVVIAPVAERAEYGERTTRNGNPMTWVSLTVHWGVWGPDGSRLDPLPCTVGESTDTSDKATNKAHTAAYKILLQQLFAVPDAAEDPDEHREEQGTPPLTVAQAKRELVAALGGDTDAASKAWGDRTEIDRTALDALIAEAVAAQQAPFDEGAA